MSPRSLLPLALCLTLACGCKFDPDIDLSGDWDWVSDFRDASAYPEGWGTNRSLDHALPVGARLDVKLTEHNTALDGGLVAHSSDSAILEVVELGGEVVSLRALREGSATVRFDTEVGGQEEVHTLRVEPVVHAEVFPFMMGFMGAMDVAPSQVESEGLALRPGAIVTFGLLMDDAEERSMSGHDFLTWSWDGGLFTEEPVYDWVNTIALRASGEEGITTIATDLGANLELRTISEDVVPELRLYDALEDTLEIDAIEGDAATGIYGLGHFDEDDRWVVPGEDEVPRITVLEGPEDLVLSWTYEDSLYGFSMVTCPGEGLIEIAHAGATLEVPVNLGYGPETSSACD